MTDLVDMYQQADIDEEEDFSDAFEDDGVDFEMVGGAGARPAGMQARRPSGNPRTGARKSADVKKIRVKVHSKAETRYITIGPAVEYSDFTAKVREKFGIRRRLRVQMQDDGDMVTIGDQDDLDVLIEGAKSAARSERQDMAKMEVSIAQVLLLSQEPN